MLSETPIVITPWLPSPSIPYAGSFVSDAVAYMRWIYTRPPVVVHLDDSFRSRSPRAAKKVVESLTRRAMARRLDHPGVPGLVHVPLPMGSDSNWLDRAQTAMALGPLISDPLTADGRPVDVHAHVGIISGVVARSFPPESRVYLYEHASFVLDLLGDPEMHALYRSALERADLLFCVNPSLAGRIGEQFPDLAHKIRVHANAVDFDRFQLTERSTSTLARWLYLGNFKEEKGSRRLIAALREVRSRGHEVSLTVVGRGPDIDWFTELSTGELEGILVVRPPVPPSAVPHLMEEADLLVHLSMGETFGLTAIEAVASGLPVLLTSTDGSEQAIRPIQPQVGSIIDQPASASDVADAFEELLANQDRLDFAPARRDLEAIYGMRNVATQLTTHLQETR